MYKKAIIGLFMVLAIFFVSELCVFELSMNSILAEQDFQNIYIGQTVMEKKDSFFGVISKAISKERVRAFQSLENMSQSEAYEEQKCEKNKLELSKKDYEALLKIVEAEAGGEDQNGKLLVANVVLNRVNNEKFPDTVWDVIMQNENGVVQFSPTKDGRFFDVEVSEDTVKAVERAMEGEDLSRGALYFCASNRVSGNKKTWFEDKLTRLFTYGNHNFYM